MANDRSLLNIMNSHDPSTETCGTLEVTVTVLEFLCYRIRTKNDWKGNWRFM